MIDALIPPVIERFPWAGHLGTQMVPQVVAAIEEGDERHRVHEHAVADGDLVPGDSRRAAGLGRDDRAASRLARPEAPRMGREWAAHRHAPMRRRDVVTRPRRGLLARRSRAAGRKPERRRATASARGPKRTPTRRDESRHVRADERAGAHRGRRGTRRRRAGAARGATAGGASARRARAARRHRRAGRRFRRGSVARRGASDAGVRRA